jgi:hypothetical protein
MVFLKTFSPLALRLFRARQDPHVKVTSCFSMTFCGPDRCGGRKNKRNKKGQALSGIVLILYALFEDQLCGM